MESHKSTGGQHFPTVPAVIFAHWREALNGSRLADHVRAGYSLAITGYLEYCRRNGLSVTFERAGLGVRSPLDDMR